MARHHPKSIRKNKVQKCEETGKIKYNSHSTAMTRLAMINTYGKSKRKHNNAYLCPYCAGWHLTSMTAEQVENLRLKRERQWEAWRQSQGIEK